MATATSARSPLGSPPSGNLPAHAEIPGEEFALQPLRARPCLLAGRGAFPASDRAHRVLTFAIVAGISGTIPQVYAALALAVSAAVVFLATVAAGFLFALALLGTLVAGFLYSMSVLPGWLETAVRVAPTSWAMESVVMSVQGGASADRIAAGWSNDRLIGVATGGQQQNPGAPAHSA